MVEVDRSVMRNIQQKLSIARGERPAELLFKNANLANVLGLDGIRYVLESTRNLPIDFFIMLPSCVPATAFETAGARLTADDLKLMIAHERIAGIAELMNYPGVYLGDESELAKIQAGKGKAIDGHAPGLTG